MFSTIAENEITVFEEFVSHFPLRDCSVLEIGGSIPKNIVQQEHPALWVSVDPVNEEEDNITYRTVRGISSQIPYPDNTFDYVFTCNAFEHISDIEETFFELKRVTKKNGAIFAHFGPIWSACDGHHLDITHKNNKYNFWETSIIPFWYHLIFSEEQLSEILTSVFEPSLVQVIVYHVYHSDWINRHFYEDYISAFQKAGLTLEHLTVTNNIDYQVNFPAYKHQLLEGLTPEKIQLMVRKKFGERYRNLFCRDMKLLLRNY